MKCIFRHHLAITTISFACVLMAFIKPKNPPSSGNDFTLIELFTSEGCSSCPPADELVARINKESAGKRIYIIAYHVDYWDRLGWKDPYSSATYSERQTQYSRWFHLPTIYTPQIVVNGKIEFVGSDETRLRKAIASNGQNSAPKLSIKASEIKSGQAEIEYDSKGKSNQALYIACIQKNATMKVEKGENRGRTLSHINIVKSLQKFNSRDQHRISFSVPKEFDSKTWEILSFSQNNSTGEILSVGLIEL